MLISLSLRSQVASVMDMLAKSAVAEICKLIDDGSAVWQLEMSRGRKENEALRRKLLQLERELELRATRAQVEFAAAEEADIIFIKEEELEGDPEKCDRWDPDGKITGTVVPPGPPDCWGRGSDERTPYLEDFEEPSPITKEEAFAEQHMPFHPSGGEELGCVGGGVKAEIEGCHSVLPRPRDSGPEGGVGQQSPPGPEVITGQSISQGGMLGLEMCRPDPFRIQNLHEINPERDVYVRGHAPSNTGAARSRRAEPPGRATGDAERTKVTCVYCGKHFAYLSYLKRHVRIHTGEKPYSCVQCGKSFSDGSSRNKHERIHTGRKPFGCAHCGKGFSRRCHLKRHQKLHGKVELLSCG